MEVSFTEWVEKHPVVHVDWLWHVLIERANGFLWLLMAKLCLRWQGVAMRFLSIISIVPCVGGELGEFATGTSTAGLQNPDPRCAVEWSCPPREERDLVCQA